MTADVANLNRGRKVNWVTAVFIGLFHIGAIAALFVANWQSVAVAAFLYWMTLSLGIGMGYHRLHTHRGYKCPKWFEYFLAICGTLTLEGGPIGWVGTHRVHHQHSDQPGDPHTPRDGKWWSHMLWIMLGEGNHNDTKKMARYAPDLARDPFYLWLNTYHYVPLVILGLGLLAVGGLPMMLWGVAFRITAGLHATWLVNSATHLWGSRRFATRDDSRNLWWVALLSFGEGWHNNHHAHPTSARHGLAWYEFDLTWLELRLLEKIGFIRDLKVARINTSFDERAAA